MRNRLKYILKYISEKDHLRRIVFSLAVMVVFVTTYLLIMPASTLTKEKASEQGGFDVPAVTETSAELSDGQNAELEVGEDTIPLASPEQQSEEDNTATDIVEDEADKATDADKSDVSGDNGETQIDGSNDSTQTEVSDSAEEEPSADEDISEESPEDGILTYIGEGYTIKVEDKMASLPENTEISVREITPDTDEEQYQKICDDALSAVQDKIDTEKKPDENLKNTAGAIQKSVESIALSAAGKESEKAPASNKTGSGEASDTTGPELNFAKIYDIQLTADGQEITPEEQVGINIEYDAESQKDLSVENSDDISVVQITEDKNEENTQADILDETKNEVEIEVRDDNLSAAAFNASGQLRFALVGAQTKAAGSILRAAGDVSGGWQNNAVDHIGLALNGSAAADVPLAYGKYYDADHNLVLEVSKFTKIHLGADEVTDHSQLVLTPEDIDNATIEARDAEGNIVSNAFEKTSVTTGGEHAGSQVMINGTFKVADLAGTDYETVDSRYGTDSEYTQAVREARLAKRIYYSVTVEKPVTFNMVYTKETADPDNPGQTTTTKTQLYDADGNLLTITVDVAYGSTFDYWDPKNKCPEVLSDNDWQSGDIPDTDNSGMDFGLTTESSQASKVYAVEITKLVVDENGNRIRTENTTSNKFYIYRNPSTDGSLVQDLDVGSYTQAPDYSGYNYQHEKSMAVAADGLGVMYDYDVEPGLYYIKEDPSSINNQITDTTGQTWDYKNTYILTEYAWRNHENDNFMHVSDIFDKSKTGENDYSSIPEILGEHKGYSDGETYTNDFLEFYVYNVYESPKVNVPVIKKWDDFAGSEYDWQANFKLQWAPLYSGETRPGSEFLDVTPIREMTINKSDMAGIDQALVDRYLAGDSTLTEDEISKIEAITFKDLPKYGTDSNGHTYRIQYSLEETSYRVTNASTGVIIYSWNQEDGYNDDDESTHYMPFYTHDAGEIESAETADTDALDTNYYVNVSNALKNISGKEEIDVTLDKQWGPTFPARDDSYYAEFELRRFVHTEYRDISHMSDHDRTADPVTVTIKNGDEVIHTLQVQPNVGLYLGGNFKPHDTAKSVTFTSDHPVSLANGSRISTITATASGSNMSNALVRSTEFFVTQDTVFTINSGVENLVEGNLARVLDTSAGTAPVVDRSFSQTIRLDNTNNWHADLEDLIRTETHSGDEADHENIVYYEYYFVEKESNPDGIAQYYRANADGSPSDILSGDSDHQIEHDDKIVAVNGPSNRLIVKKNWRGVPDTTGFPAVKFTLYQAWADGNDGWVYENPDTHARYEHIELKGNSLEWICPEELPATRMDGNRSRAVKYYIQEDQDSRSGSMSKDGITTSWQFYYYLSSYKVRNGQGQEVEETKQTNAGHQGYFAPVPGADLLRSGGTITICNKMNTYMQMDIQKQYFKLEEAGSWDNVTAHADMKRNAVLGFQVIRAVKAPDGKWLDEAGNESDDPVWLDYGEEMLCGYDENGRAVVHRGENDIFWLHDAGGDWHFRIEDNQGDATSVAAGGSGLPSYGFFIRNGEDIPVEYWYSFRETNVYKNLNKDPYPEWDWFSSITPVNAYGPNGTIEAFPKAFHGQDGKRIANFQASDLIIDKAWTGGDPDAKSVYVKIWRTSGDSEPEDFTAIIAEDVRNNKNWQNYLNDPSAIDLKRDALIIDLDDSGSGTSSIKVNRALLGSLAETGEYHYYIQEVGYKTADGVYRTNVNGKYKPLYDKWVDGHYTDAPVGMNDYAANNISIGAKGENRLKVINRRTPSTSYTVKKAFHGPQSSTGGQSSVTGKYPTDGSKHVVVELQQRYRYEKTEGGVDYVSADNEHWVEADSEAAKTTWTVDWQGAESADPTSVALPLPKPAGSVLPDDAWYGSAAAWTYTWEGLDTKKVVSEDADPDKSKIAQLYYRAVEVSTPEWFNSVISAEEQDGHKAIDDSTQTDAGILSEKNTVTNERNDVNLNLDKVWTGLGEGKTWPDGYTIDYQLIQHFHLALADMHPATGPDGKEHIIPTYSVGKIVKSVDMTTTNTGAANADSVHPQAIGVNVGKPADGSTTIAKITGLPEYGFMTATAEDVAAARAAGVILKEGTVYPVVYTYSAKETAVKKNGVDVPFKPQTVSAERVEGTTDPITYEATLTNELVSVKVEKDWNGITPTSAESATIGLYRFEKDPEPEPETTFKYTVSVTGDADALSSDGYVTANIYDEENNLVESVKFMGDFWSYEFELDIGKTYHAEFTGDGTILNEEVNPSSSTGISETGSIELTASLKPVEPQPTGSAKLVVTGKPNGLWMNALQENVNGNWSEVSPQKQWSPHYFNGNGGETSVITELMPGRQYRFQIGAEPSSVDNATYSDGFVTFTAADGLTTITLNYDGGGGEETEDNITVTASITNWVSWPPGGNAYYMNYNTSTPPASGTIVVHIKGAWGHEAGTIELSADNNWTASATINQKNLSGYANGERISQASCSYTSPIEGADATYNNGIVSVTGKYPESAAATQSNLTASQASSNRMSIAKLAKGIVRATLGAAKAITWNNDKSGLPEGANPDDPEAGELDELVETVTFSGDTWSKTWEELPKYSPDGKEYVYYAYETAYTGVDSATAMKTTYSVDENGKLIVTNTPTVPDKGNVIVTKEVFYGNSLNTAANGLKFTVGIFTDQAGTTRVSGQEDQTITVSEGTGEVTFTGLDAGTYYVYEVVGGNAVTTSGSKATIGGNEYTVTYENNTVTVTNGSTAAAKVVNTKEPFELNLIKRDKNNNTIRLNGAVFTLNKLLYNPDSEKKISYDPDFEARTVTTAKVGDNDGVAKFDNLSLGYYEISETQAPDGYILTGNATFCIRVTSTGVQIVTRDDNTDPDEWVVPEGGKTGDVTFTAEGETYTATVDNTPGAQLPSAGGIGTTIFYILGSILLIGSLVYFVSKRRAGK